MKRIGRINGVKLYDLIKDRDNVKRAIKESTKGHRKDPTIQRMLDNPEPYIDAVVQILEDGTFHYSKFRRKVIYERGKWRKLCYTRTFPDRVIQHAVMQVVGPIILGTCTEDTFAAREGKGIHHASVRVRKQLDLNPELTTFCFKFDVHHYFESVSRTRLFDKLKAKLKCRRTLEILHRMIFDCPGDDGLLIGLYTSQIFSSFYLSAFDHYVKEVLGAMFYTRYMDDGAILWRSTHLLRHYKYYIQRFLAKEGLQLKGNWQYFRVASRGIDFLGYVMRQGYARVRKRVKLSYKRVCAGIVNAVCKGEKVTTHQLMSRTSYEGMMSWCDAKHLIKRIGGRADRALAIGPEAI